MKKYVKPELFYEHFELSQHIADCDWELQFDNGNACIATGDPVRAPGMTIFTAICNMAEDAIEDYCYHDGAAGLNVFQS